MGAHSLAQARHKLWEKLLKLRRGEVHLPCTEQLAHPEPKWITDDQWKGAPINYGKIKLSVVEPYIEDTFNVRTDSDAEGDAYQSARDKFVPESTAGELASHAIEHLDRKEYRNARRFMEEIVEKFSDREEESE